FLVPVDDPDPDGLLCRRRLRAGLAPNPAAGHFRQNSAKRQRPNAGGNVEKHHQHRGATAHRRRSGRPAGRPLFRY
ncbi:inner membrane protein YhjD, partial [Klebsiella pneumoniae]